MTFGPALGHDGKTYNGKDFRQFANSLAYATTVGGVMGAEQLVVSAQSTPNATVKIAAGRAVIPATGAGLTGFYHVYNDSSVNTAAFTATGADPRTDRVILRVDASGNVAPEIVAGTPGPGVPAPPTVTGDNYLVLARVEIPAGTSTITGTMIVPEARVIPQANTRVESSLLPFLTPADGDLNYEPDTGHFQGFTGGVWKSLLAVSAGGRTQADTPTVVLNNDGLYVELRTLNVSPTRYCVAAITVTASLRTSNTATPGDYDWRARVQVGGADHPLGSGYGLIDGWVEVDTGAGEGYDRISETIFWPLAPGTHTIDFDAQVAAASPAAMRAYGMGLKVMLLDT